MYAPGELLEALVGAYRRRWTHTDELLALLLTKLDELTIVTGKLWGDPKTLGQLRNAKPFVYPRPVKPPRPRPATPSEIAAFFRK